MSKTNVVEQFKAAKLYVITTPPPRGLSDYPEMVEAACQGGADIIQFRDKLLKGKDRFDVAGRLRKICRKHKVLFIVNDALEVALAIAADGVHFGQDDMATKTARDIMFPMGIKNFLIGRSTHSLEQAKAAEQDGVDYIGIGPVYSTPTKPTYQPVGLELVRQVTSAVATPHVAIGGIDATNVLPVLAAGAQRVAVVRAVCGQRHIREAAKQMKQIIVEAPALA